MSGGPIFAVTQPDGTASVLDLSMPGAYQDFAFEAVHADGRRDYFRAYHTGERGIFIDVVTRLAAGRATAAVLIDLARVRAEVATHTADLSPTTSPSRSRAFWPAVPAERSWPFSHSYSVDGRTRRAGLIVTGDKHGLRFSERRGRQPGLKVAIATDELWQFAAGMMWRSYEHRALLSRVCTDEYADVVARLEAAIAQ